jgi:hypothetical protein
MIFQFLNNMLLDLPNEVIIIICEFIPIRDYARLSVICTRVFCILSSDENPNKYLKRLYNIFRRQCCDRIKWKLPCETCIETCADCGRKLSEGLFTMRDSTMDNYFNLVPICKFGCSFVCILCENIFTQAKKVRAVDGWIFCKQCVDVEYCRRVKYWIGTTAAEFYRQSVFGKPHRIRTSYGDINTEDPWHKNVRIYRIGLSESGRNYIDYRDDNWDYLKNYYSEDPVDDIAKLFRK